MRHGESQEKGQEESQEEVILLALCQRRARDSLARRLKFEDTARYQAGSVVSEVEKKERCRERAKHWKTSRRTRCAGIRRRRKGARRRHRVHGEFPHR